MSQQFAVFHAMKGKGRGGSLGNHIDRTSTPHNADSDRVHLNRYIVHDKEDGAKILSQQEYRREIESGNIKSMFASVNERIEEGYQGKTAIRKDAVRYVNLMLSGSHEKMKEIEREGKLEDWMKDNYRFVAKEFGKDNIVRFAMHADEKTPHVHATVVPLTEDGRLSAREYLFGHKEKLKGFQDRYAQEMKEYGLERGVRETRSKHKTTQQYYKEIENPNKPKITIPERSPDETKEQYQRRVERSLEPVVLRSAAVERELQTSKDRTERVERRNTILQSKNDNLVSQDKEKEESLNKYLKMVREKFPEAVKDKDRIGEYGQLIGEDGFVKYNPMFKEIAAMQEKDRRERGEPDKQFHHQFGKETAEERSKVYLALVKARFPEAVADKDKIDEYGRLIGENGAIKHNPMINEIQAMQEKDRKERGEPGQEFHHQFGKETQEERLERYLRMVKARYPEAVGDKDRIDEQGRLVGGDGFVKHNPMLKEIVEMQKREMGQTRSKEFYYGLDRDRDNIIGYD